MKNWNSTQLYHTQQKVKRTYYLSFEFLMGRQLDQALLNLDIKKPYYEEATHKLGFPLEDLVSFRCTPCAHSALGGCGPYSSFDERVYSSTLIPR